VAAHVLRQRLEDSARETPAFPVLDRNATPQISVAKVDAGSKRTPGALWARFKAAILTAHRYPVAKLNRQGCRTVAIEQHLGTCFLASATLVASRVFLKHIKVPEVRKYILLANANQHQGNVNAVDDYIGSAACPLIPKTIRQWYTKLVDRFIDSDFPKFGLTALNVCSHGCSKDTITNLTDGGYAHLFLPAVLWAGGITAQVSRVHQSLKGPPTESYLSSEHVQLMQEIYSDASSLDSDTFTKKVQNLNKQLYRWIPAAYLMDIQGDRPGGTHGYHVVAVFPCKGGYVLCNSHGEPCMTTLDAGIRSLQNRYDTVASITGVYVPRLWAPAR
jgi:hypothetical protein